MAQYEEKVVVRGEDRASDKFRQAGGSFEAMGDRIKKVAQGAGLVLVAKQILDIGVSSVRMAVDAGEAAAAFGTTFGPALGRASAFVDEFANKAGFARYELEQMLAITGNVVQGIGATEEQSAELSIQMATLAGDVASFSNAAGGAQAVLAALQSAINGEREALKTYGLAISETEVQQRALIDTGKDRAEQLTRLEKAEATVALAYEKAGKAIGDLDRTSDSAANTLRRIGARAKEAGVELGEALLGGLEPVLPVIEDLIPTIGSVATAIGKLIAAIGPLVAAVGKLLNPALKAAADYLDLVAYGAESIASIWDDSARAGLRMREAIEFINEEIANGVDPAVALSNALLHVALDGELTAEQFQTLAARAGVAGTRLVDVQNQLLGWAATAGDARVTTDELNTAFGIQAEKMFTTADAADRASSGFRTLAGAAAKPLPAITNLTTEMLLLVEAGENVNDMLLAQADPLFNAVDAWESYLEAQKRVHEDGKVSAEEAIGLLEEELRLAAAMGDLDSTAYERAMEAIQLSTGLSRDEIEALLDRLEEIDGRTFRSRVEVTIDEVAGGGSGSRRGRSFRNPYLSHTGGMVPDINNGGPVPSLLLPGEVVYTSAEHQRLLAMLGQRSQERPVGNANFSFDITVHASGDADGDRIGRDIEARLARSDLIRRLPERIL